MERNDKFLLQKHLGDGGGPQVVAYLPYSSGDRVASFSIPVAAIAAVVQAAIKVVEANDLASWKKSVSSSLNEISRKLDEIILELKRLKLWMDERITEEARRAFHSEIEARRKGVEDILFASGGELKPEQIARLEREFFDQTKRITDQLANWAYYGFVHYEGVLSGLLTVILISKMIRAEEREVKFYAGRMTEDFLIPCIDPSNPKSLEYARNEISKSCIVRHETMRANLSRWWTISVDRGEDYLLDAPQGPGDKPLRPTYVVTSVKIEGSLETGFTFESRQKIKRSGSADDPWYPGLNRRSSLPAASDFVRADQNHKRSQVFESIEEENRMRAHVDGVRQVIEQLSGFAAGRPE